MRKHVHKCARASSHPRPCPCTRNIWIGFASQSQSKRDGLALLRKAFPSWRIGFALQSLSIVLDWICFANPISSGDFCFASQSLSIVMELALLRKAFLNYRIGFASQCQTISTVLFCFAKSILYDGVALLRKAFPSWWMGFASQSLLNWWIGFASQSRSI